MTAAPESAKLLALADWLAKQREYHQGSVACKDEVIVAHIARLQGWENAVRLAAKPADEVREATIGSPRLTDNDEGEITVTLNGKELRGWSYKDDTERRTKMLAAREYVEGWRDGRDT